jgi:hypothetical protein
MEEPSVNRREYLSRSLELAPRGNSLPQAKLSDTAVRKAREMHTKAMFAKAYIDANFSVAGLARKFNVSKSAMEKALSGETWSHVE